MSVNRPTVPHPKTLTPPAPRGKADPRSRDRSRDVERTPGIRAGSASLSASRVRVECEWHRGWRATYAGKRQDRAPLDTTSADYLKRPAGVLVRVLGSCSTHASDGGGAQRRARAVARGSKSRVFRRAHWNIATAAGLALGGGAALRPVRADRPTLICGPDFTRNLHSTARRPCKCNAGVQNRQFGALSPD